MKKNWNFDTEAYERLSCLTNIISPVMEEIPMASYLRKIWLLDQVSIKTDVIGNVCASLVGAKPIHVGLVAHMDTVCIQITKILPNGYLQFRSIGLKPHVLLGAYVHIATKNNILNGIIGFDPTSQYGQPKGLVEDDLWLDIGATDKNAASLLVEVGDLAVLKPHFNILNERYISASGIDNRIGLFIVNECLRWFAENGAPLHLHFIGSVQEEIGLRGAAICISKLPLDACFVIDTDYATDTLTPHENQMGELRLGDGVGMHKKADNNSVLQHLVLECAKSNSIPIQMSLGRFVFGGTDASILQLQAGGIATLNINIPCRYMHSPVELCHKLDVENSINLLIFSICQIAKINKASFIPGIDVV